MDKHLYCRLGNGELVPKRRVEAAIELIAKLQNGFEVVQLTDEELFAKGESVDAVLRFHEKHDTSVREAKYAIDFLRGKEIN